MEKPRGRKVGLLLVSLAIFACMQLSAHAQDAWNVELVGQIGGNCKAVFVQGDYAYIGEGPGLRILDISDPTNPQAIGKVLLPDIVLGVYVSGNCAYVADGLSGLRVIDISNPASPVEVGYFLTPDFAYGVYVSGNYAYVADGDRGLRVIDISNPASPVEVGYCDTPGSARDVYVSGSYAYVAYVADWYSGLRIINISNPALPVEAGYVGTPGEAHGVCVSGNYAYVADSGRVIRVIDISNPASPVEVGYCDTPDYAYGVYVSGNYAYVADWRAGLRVVDISNPASTAEVGYYNTPGHARGVYVSGNYACVANGSSGLGVIDITNPASPVEVGYCDTPGLACGVHVAGNYAYVADWSSGLRVIDISNPASPVEAGYYDTPGYAMDVYVSGNYVYVADSQAGLRVVDISNPAWPVEVGYYDPFGWAQIHSRGVHVAGNYAYVADNHSKLRVIDVSNPASPVEVAYYITARNSVGVYVSGNYAYVANSYAGLRVINISNPASPVEAGYYDTPGYGYAQGVYVSGNYAYVADSDCGLFILRFTGFSDFTQESDGWTTQSAPVFFTPPNFSWEPDFLKLISSTNTNTFGYWLSPQMAVSADYVHRARFKVMTNITNEALVPHIRLRVNSLNLQQYDVLSIESAGDGGASSTPTGRDYNLYFVPPANDTAVTFAFDLLNFDPDDAAVAELALDSVTVDRFALDSLSTATIVQDYTFALIQEGWTPGGAPVFFTQPDYMHSDGALELRALTNTNTFGYWVNNPSDITIEADRLYRGTFEVRTDVINRALVPEMRLRFNAGNFQASQTLGITSAGEGSNSPGTTNTLYDRLYFLPPAACVGESLIVSFDILNFNPDDAAEASLILDRATIESLPLPSTP